MLQLGPLSIVLSLVVLVMSSFLLFGREKWDPKGKVRLSRLSLTVSVNR